MLKIGIAGIGFIAEEYIKLFYSNKINNAVICALSSRNYEHMENIKSTYSLHQAELFQSYSAMLASGRIDAVIICTPHFFHAEMAMQAIECGIHTLIEKPVGVFPKELKDLQECINRNPSILSGVLYCRRYSEAFVKLKQLISGGSIGNIKRITWIITDMYRPQVYFKANPWKGSYKGEGGGLLMTQVSHQIDLLVWLCGLPISMRAFCKEGNERDITVENEATAYFEYSNGAAGQFIASSRECPGSNRLEISGSCGQAVLENYSSLTFRALAQSEELFAAKSKNPYGRIKYKEHTFNFTNEENTALQAGIINNFISAVTEGGAVLCPVNEAVNTQLFIEAAYLSSWLGKTVTLPANANNYTNELKKRIALQL